MTEPLKEKRKRGRPRSATSAVAGGTVLALDRGLVIMEAIAKLQSATLSDLAEHVDMPPSTVHRILATLQSHNFADFDTRLQEWAIGIGAFRVGSTYLARANLIEASLIVLRELTSQTGETANLGIAEAGNIVFISQVETQNPIRAMFRQGTGSPMHASGIGKAMLAEMPREKVAKQLAQFGQSVFTPQTITEPEPLYQELGRIAECGWAVDNEERYLGMRCVAATVFNAQGEPIAGVSVSGPTARMTDQMLAKTGPMVKAAAARLTAMIGGIKT